MNSALKEPTSLHPLEQKLKSLSQIWTFVLLDWLSI